MFLDFPRGFHHHLLGIPGWGLESRDPPCTVILRSYITTRILGSLHVVSIGASSRQLQPPSRPPAHPPSPLFRSSNSSCRPSRTVASIPSQLSRQRSYVASCVCACHHRRTRLSPSARHVAARPPASAAASASDGATVSTFFVSCVVVRGGRHVYRGTTGTAAFAPSTVDPSPSSSAVCKCFAASARANPQQAPPPPAALFIH
jgi:hypothetical protein